MKIILRHKALFVIVSITLSLIVACEKKYFVKPPGPKVAVQTTALEATYVSTAPLTLSDSYWKNADYLKVSVGNLNKNALYSNGYLNMTGTYGGTSSFNAGGDPKLTMKAAYDDSKLYIYVEWVDNNLDATNALATLLGASDPLKSDTTGQWTSQGNSDKMAIAFDLNNSSSSEGTFVDKGCAASCHQGKMQPAAGSVDIWSWDVATTDALGYAADMVTDANKGLVKDTGNAMVTSNKKVPGNPRSQPAYEWNGVDQSFTRPDGKTTLLDAGYYLLNTTATTNITPFIGDYHKGDLVYHNSVYGCGHCHGDEGGGDGPSGSATPFAAVGFAKKYSRASLISFASSGNHEGNTYWSQVPAASVNDLIAYIKGLGGVPGVLLSPPSGSHADVWSVSNVTRSRINVTPHTLYQVILVRKLNTGNTDDVQFTTPEGKSYPFGIALMNADGKNHIGSLKQMLTFKLK